MADSKDQYCCMEGVFVLVGIGVVIGTLVSVLV